MALPRNESYAARLTHAQATIMGSVTSGRLREAADLAVQLVERFSSAPFSILTPAEYHALRPVHFIMGVQMVVHHDEGICTLPLP